MNERYSRLFTAEKNLYSPGFPVILEAGALLKDNDTNSVLAQLKLLNITEKTITAVKLWIIGIDSFGNQVEKRDFQLLDLAAKRNEKFGQKIPLILENNTVRSFTTQLSEIVFSDGTSAVMPEVELVSLGEPETLSEHLKNNNLVQQYRIDNDGDDCFYVPMEISDLWLCTCGTFNHSEDVSCCTCRRERQRVFLSFDTNTLTTESTLRYHNDLYNQAMNFFNEGNLDSITRAQKIFHHLEDFKNSSEMQAKCSDIISKLEQELKLAEEAEKTRAAKEKKTKRTIKIAVSVVTVCILGVLLVFCVIIPNIREIKYNHASKLLNSGKYEEAAEAFEELGYYSNSESKKQAAQYYQAIELQDAGAFEKAAKLFELVGRYEDSVQRLQYCNARILENAQNYVEAANLYKKLGTFEDSVGRYLDMQNKQKAENQ